MTTDLARTALDELDELTDELPSITLEPGKINWYHGVDAGKVKTPGVFFGKETAFTEPPPLPWETDERYIDSDGLGYSVAKLRIAFIGQREQWFIPGATDKDPITWLPNGTRAPEGTKVKKQVEYLILVDGLPDPMVLSVSGYYKSRPVAEILRAYERGALAQVIRQRKKAAPRWTHWLTIGGKVGPDGKPMYEKAKDSAGDEYGSIVTPPAMVAPPEIVSAEVFRRGIDTWNLYNDLGWFKFQRTNRDAVEASYVVEQRPALPAGRNVPQPVTEADIDGEPLPF